MLLDAVGFGLRLDEDVTDANLSGRTHRDLVGLQIRVDLRLIDFDVLIDGILEQHLLANDIVSVLHGETLLLENGLELPGGDVRFDRRQFIADLGIGGGDLIFVGVRLDHALAYHFLSPTM